MCGDSALRLGWLTTCRGAVVGVVIEPTAAVVVVVGGWAAAVQAPGDWRRRIAVTRTVTAPCDAAHHGTRESVRVELIAAPWGPFGSRTVRGLRGTTEETPAGSRRGETVLNQEAAAFVDEQVG